MDDSRGARQNPATNDMTEDEIGKLSCQWQWISLESE